MLSGILKSARPRFDILLGLCQSNWPFSKPFTRRDQVCEEKSLPRWAKTRKAAPRKRCSTSLPGWRYRVWLFQWYLLNCSCLFNNAHLSASSFVGFPIACNHFQAFHLLRFLPITCKRLCLYDIHAAVCFTCLLIAHFRDFIRPQSSLDKCCPRLASGVWSKILYTMSCWSNISNA